MTRNKNVILGISIITITLSAFYLVPVSNNTESQEILKQIKLMENKIDKNSDFFVNQLTEIKEEFQDRVTYLDMSLSEMRTTIPVLAQNDINKDILYAKQQLSEIEEKLANVVIESTMTTNAITENNRVNEPQVERSDEEIAAQETEVQERQMALLDSILENEESDPDWSTATEDHISTRLNVNNSKLAVANILCGSSMCRVEANLNSDDPTEVFRSFDEQINWEGQMFMTIDPATNQATVYLGRKDVELQRIAQH